MVATTTGRSKIEAVKQVYFVGDKWMPKLLKLSNLVARYTSSITDLSAPSIYTL